MKKKFDSVAFQRKVRAQLGREYRSNRQAFLRELRERYGHLQNAKARAGS